MTVGNVCGCEMWEEEEVLTMPRERDEKRESRKHALPRKAVFNASPSRFGEKWCPMVFFSFFLESQLTKKYVSLTLESPKVKDTNTNTIQPYATKTYTHREKNKIKCKIEQTCKCRKLQGNKCVPVHACVSMLFIPKTQSTEKKSEKNMNFVLFGVGCSCRKRKSLLRPEKSYLIYY